MKHYYMFNKPFGCVTAHRDDRFPVVMDYFRSLENDRLSPVGRLDRETEGLLMITDDGIWNQKMTNPAFHVPKTYEFAALGTLNEENLQRLSEGVLLIGSDRPTTGASVTVTGTSILSKVVPHLHPDMQEKLKYNLPDHPVVFGTITISEGRKRQIRRMLKVVGCCVIRLKRISMGSIVLDEKLAPGEYKEIELS
ncbi:pseudouridine synthase [Hominiventricola filiformis]|uniref:Pseudouridine synthase n=1 Tax=Hominiventricola filiformis TaxID=2885352 RepID=A0AAE3DAR4_9FIRM|nr:pseudouridine synthase [Hominiventricola filiformis]MCC2126082.1 pseudouridine synthase [Hominiventricola filiformis]